MAEQLSQFAFAAEVRRLIHDVYAECDSKVKFSPYQSYEAAFVATYPFLNVE
jgi:hypothetical protein